jgi:hypothetical protein
VRGLIGTDIFLPIQHLADDFQLGGTTTCSEPAQQLTSRTMPALS